MLQFHFLTLSVYAIKIHSGPKLSEENCLFQTIQNLFHPFASPLNSVKTSPVFRQWVSVINSNHASKLLLFFADILFVLLNEPRPGGYGP